MGRAGQPRSERRTQNRVVALFTDPTRREARAELNELPLSAEAWSVKERPAP